MATLARIVRPVLSALFGGCAVAVALAGCGGSSTSTPAKQASVAHPHTVKVTRPKPIRVSYRALYTLPAPLQDPAYAPIGSGRFALLGGIDSSDSSTDSVLLGDAHAAQHAATLPNPQHDAQAAALGGSVYVFGGGNGPQYDHILRFTPGGGTVAPVGALPRPASDVAVTELAGTAYIVGGFDGVNWLDTIVAWRPGGQARVVAHLPVAVRYAATAAAGNKVLIIGGSTPNGVTHAIYSFDPASASVQKLGHLRHAITHGSAATLDGTVYLVGGRGDSLDSQTSAIWAINPLTGAVHRAGHLPQPLSDAGVVAIGNAIVVAGGRSPSATQSAVGELVP